MKHIVVIASACRSSGALSILKQFIDSILERKDNIIYHIIVDPTFKYTQDDKVSYYYICTRSWKSRIYWDFFGFNSWLIKQDFTPDLLISLQNTSVRLKMDIPKVVYYHQPLPLEKQKWSFFKKQERLFFLYKYIYPFFVKSLHTKHTYLVVQIPSIKEKYSRKFNISKSKIRVFSPKISKINDSEILEYPYTKKEYHFIYPATPLIYKNHTFLLDVLSKIKVINLPIFEKIRLHFTFEKYENKCLSEKVKHDNLAKQVIFEGKSDYQTLLRKYKSSRALLFPSYIETFGLPLIEAAMFGLPILAPNIAYARDVIGSYEGAKFIDLDDKETWAKEIIKICQTSPSFKGFFIERPGWNEFFEFIQSLL